MTKLLSALVAALFALGSVSPAFAAADEKGKDKAKEVKAQKAEGKKKSDDKKDDKAKK